MRCVRRPRKGPVSSPAGSPAAPFLSDDDGGDDRTMHPGAAFFLVAAVIGGFAVIGLVNLLRWTSGTVATTASLLLMTGCFALQMFHCNPYTRRARRRYGYRTLALQTVMTFSLLPLAGTLSGSMAGFLGGSFFVVLRRRAAWVLYLALNAVLFTESRGEDVGPGPLYSVLSSLALGLIVHGLGQLSDLVMAQHRARSQATWIAVSSERVRFARDLHDLLGYSLSAITLKSELILRLIGTNDERARSEMRENLTIARQALADIRAVVSGYRSMSLARELTLVTGVLGAADIRVSVDAPADLEGLEPRVSAQLATVLREAVANVLRHSQATRCRIVLEQYAGRISLSVSNDGVPAAHPEAAGARRRGSGLDNLAARMAAVGGRVTALSCDDWFYVRAECPLSPAARGGQEPGAAAEPVPAAAHPPPGHPARSSGAQGTPPTVGDRGGP